MPSQVSSPLIAILGPTGSGKSALALVLAVEFSGEIVNCDSVQVYKRLDIGSAKASPLERAGVQHHLLDVISADEELTAGAYARLARSVIAEVTARGNLPIVTGGTGFYFRALFDGLAPAPQRDPELRARLRSIVERHPQFLSRFVRRFDPATAGRIHPNDRQKLIRAVEMICLDRKPASQTLAAERNALCGFSVLKIGLSPGRKLLNAGLNERTASMFRGGLLEETQNLLTAGVSPNAKALQTLGYRQAVRVLRSELSFEDAIAECQLRTRQYAKRQMTWFRTEPEVHWLQDFGSKPEIQDAAKKLTAEFLTAF